MINKGYLTEKNRSLILPSVKSHSVYFRLHEEGATAGHIYDVMGKDANFADLTLAGTTTAIWSANPGWFTPNAAGTYTELTTADSSALCALDTLNDSGGVLIVAEVNIGSNPGSGSERIFHFGTNAANGQYGFGFTYGANANLNFIYQETSGTASQASKNITSLIGSDIIVAGYFDVSNNQVDLYANDSTSPTTTSMNTDGTVRPGTTLAHGLGIFNRPQDNSFVMGAAGSGVTIRDLVVIRFTSDKSGSIPNIVQGFIDTRTELPWEMESV